MSSAVLIPSLFKHGSTWVRADFHMHTLADKEFSYSGDPNYFVSEYVAALKKADIRVAVITNHNKFDRDDFKVLAKAARTDRTVFMYSLFLAMNGSRTKKMLTTSRASSM
jgi:chromosome segregation protein